LLVGLGFGATLVCVPTIVGNYWGIEAFAGINGLVMMVPTTLAALAPPIAGFIYDLQASYFTMIVISWIGAAIGLAAILMCKPPRHKEA
jgi:MFS family permease